MKIQALSCFQFSLDLENYHSKSLLPKIHIAGIDSIVAHTGDTLWYMPYERICRKDKMLPGNVPLLVFTKFCFPADRVSNPTELASLVLRASSRLACGPALHDSQRSNNPQLFRENTVEQPNQLVNQKHMSSRVAEALSGACQTRLLYVRVWWWWWWGGGGLSCCPSSSGASCWLPYY